MLCVKLNHWALALPIVRANNANRIIDFFFIQHIIEAAKILLFSTRKKIRPEIFEADGLTLIIKV